MILDAVKKSGIMIVPLGAMFILSGIFVNIVQFVLFLIFWNSNRNLFRKLNQQVVTLNWGIFIAVTQFWGDYKLKVYGDWDTVGDHRGLVILNHSSDIDWLLGWMCADRFNMLGGTKAFMKNSAKHLPILGYSWRFCEFIWLQ